MKIAVIGVIIGCLVGTGLVAVNYFGFSNSGVSMEENIDAQVRENANRLNNLTQTALETMSVAREYKDAVADVIRAGIEGRAEGGKLATMLTEAYPAQFDSALFTRVQQVIEANRNEFAKSQTMLISKVQVYRTDLRKPWSGFWLKSAGFPTIDLSQPEYNPIVGASTRDAFKTGVDTGIKF